MIYAHIVLYNFFISGFPIQAPNILIAMTACFNTGTVAAKLNAPQLSLAQLFMVWHIFSFQKAHVNTEIFMYDTWG